MRSRKGYVCLTCKHVVTPQSPCYEDYEYVKSVEDVMTRHMEAYARGESVPSKALLVETERGGEV